MSGPETEESNGWNGIGLTRGAAVKKKKIRSNTSLFMYSGLKKVPYGHTVVWDEYAVFSPGFCLGESQGPLF